MAAITQEIRITVTAGTDVISKASYVSGDAKDVRQLDIQSSGLQSGVDLSFALNSLKSFVGVSSIDSMRMTAYGLSGGVQFNLAASVPLLWWSGNGFSNPFAQASGNVTGFSFQNLSGNASGYLELQVVKDSTP